MGKQAKKILIIEDEPDLLEMYHLYFDRAGYDVVDAADGQIDIGLIRQERPDLVLLDILLSKIDGWQILKDIKSNSETKDVPVVIFSNLAQAEEIEKGLKLGAADYLIKSNSTPKDLLVKIQKFLGEK